MKELNIIQNKIDNLNRINSEKNELYLKTKKCLYDIRQLLEKKGLTNEEKFDSILAIVKPETPHGPDWKLD